MQIRGRFRDEHGCRRLARRGLASSAQHLEQLVDVVGEILQLRPIVPDRVRARVEEELDRTAGRGIDPVELVAEYALKLRRVVLTRDVAS